MTAPSQPYYVLVEMRRLEAEAARYRAVLMLVRDAMDRYDKLPEDVRYAVKRALNSSSANTAKGGGK